MVIHRQQLAKTTGLAFNPWNEWLQLRLPSPSILLLTTLLILSRRLTSPASAKH